MTNDAPDFQLEALSEAAWLLRLGNTMDTALNARVHAMASLLHAVLPGVECVPAYASVLLRFDRAAWPVDATMIDGEHLRETITALWDRVPELATPTREVVLPVWYAGEDIDDVAAHAQLTTTEVIARHTAATYRVAMLGFAPGFPYLLGLDPSLAMPRRGTPRTLVPAGSVAIGGLQTGIYPRALPGGWQLIGRTPLRLFDLSAAVPSLLQPGDRVRFRAIDEREYTRLATEAGTTP
ncbi:5-oxoprolinase subunit PxpB [Dyella sp. C11]|uniref:5-oxoprolinase subunit PxpB n=1 Tax=Dyella sp. C11 TaxID=2126991 RepID=UPI000D6576EC|nr:5-oxoprolinase subunit PxpB [Dyella sp. C11]